MVGLHMCSWIKWYHAVLVLTPVELQCSSWPYGPKVAIYYVVEEGVCVLAIVDIEKIVFRGYLVSKANHARPQLATR
jgi:hypothetical protein